MRYTEARLTPFAEVLLAELEQGTVDWAPNFDGTLHEPGHPPGPSAARVAQRRHGHCGRHGHGYSAAQSPGSGRRLYPSSGAPWGDGGQLCAYIQGPDFPTEAEIITPREEIVRLYETGGGTIRMRARYEKDHGDIIITALPYQVSGAKILEQIATQMRAKSSRCSTTCAMSRITRTRRAWCWCCIPPARTLPRLWRICLPLLISSGPTASTSTSLASTSGHRSKICASSWQSGWSFVRLQWCGACNSPGPGGAALAPS